MSDLSQIIDQALSQKTVETIIKISPEIEARRHQIAELEFENFDFSPETVEDQGTWEYDVPGNDYSRAVYFESEDGDASVKGYFTVIFQNGSDRVKEVYAMIDGDIFGKRSLPAYQIMKLRAERFGA